LVQTKSDIDGGAAAFPESGGGAALDRLRAFLGEVPLDGRLPPERDLAVTLGVSRAELRKALSALERDGVLWRHVGKGTFLGSRPIDTVADVAAMTRRTNPSEVMQARLALEPEIVRLAALNATAADVAEMRNCIARTHQAETWRQYEAWDNRLHRTIGEAAQNGLLLGLLDTLNAVRRAVTSGAPPAGAAAAEPGPPLLRRARRDRPGDRRPRPGPRRRRHAHPPALGRPQPAVGRWRGL